MIFSSNIAMLFLLAVFATVGLGLFGVVSLSFRVRARDLRHLGTAANEIPALRTLRPVLERLAYIASLLPQQGHRAWAGRMLRQANLIQQWSPELLEAVKLLAAVGGFVLAFVLCHLWGLGTPWLALVVIAIAGYFIPDAALYSRASERQANMRKNLPFIIDLLAVSAEAGLAFQQAIRNVVSNSARSGSEGGEQQIVNEFELLLNNLQMGRTMEDALRETARRISLDEFNIFANSILQAERLGTPVSEALKSQSRELRHKLAARVETLANQAPVKILFPLIIFIFPVTAWVIVGPVLLRVFYGNY